MGSIYIPAGLRHTVEKRADRRCEYCLIPDAVSFASHEVDHIIARKHRGHTHENNLALSCVLCNKHKGSDIASIDSETGAIEPLYHPRHDHWSDNFILRDAYIIPQTPTGRVTVQLLQLNNPDRVAERTFLIVGGFYVVPD